MPTPDPEDRLRFAIACAFMYVTVRGLKRKMTTAERNSFARTVVVHLKRSGWEFTQREFVHGQSARCWPEERDESGCMQLQSSAFAVLTPSRGSCLRLSSWPLFHAVLSSGSSPMHPSAGSDHRPSYWARSARSLP